MAPTSDQPRVHDVECRVTVETPEQIQLTFQLAGAGTRMMAYTVDILIRYTAVLVVSLFVMMLTGFAAPELGMGIMLLIIFAVEWSYHTVIEWLWNGYTPGKRALGLRVVRTNGVSVDLMRSAIRNLLRAADIFPFGYATGLLVMFFSKMERRLGDLVADTMVIREEKVRLRDLPPLPAGADDVAFDGLPLPRLKEKDLSLIDELFRRRHYFSKDRADELAEILTESWFDRRLVSGQDPEKVLAAILVRARERRSSWFGVGFGGHR
jgi:uncharacterized RDD family membrane protein YckC